MDLEQFTEKSRQVLQEAQALALRSSHQRNAGGVATKPRRNRVQLRSKAFTDLNFDRCDTHRMRSRISTV